MRERQDVCGTRGDIGEAGATLAVGEPEATAVAAGGHVP